jgi:SulP family sulfate permease
LSGVPFVDSTAANTLEGIAHKARRKRVTVVLTGTTHALRAELFAQRIRPPLVRYERSIESALAKLRLRRARGSTTAGEDTRSSMSDGS